MSYATDPYDPCPCGSGRKFKFCCSRKRGSGKYPVGTLAYYGPDDKICTKIVISVIKCADAEPILERFIGTSVYGDAKVAEKIKAFFTQHMVRNVVISSGIMGCLHEEGIDFPDGENCPFLSLLKGQAGDPEKIMSGQAQTAVSSPSVFSRTIARG